MLLLPQIGWESQRDLTHSVLVTGMASMTLWLALTMLERKPGCRHYLLLGLLIGTALGAVTAVHLALSKTAERLLLPLLVSPRGLPW